MHLYNHQKEILELNPNKSLLCWDTGTGKTRAAIEYGEQNKGDVLVITPKAVFEKWAREVHIWCKTDGETRSLNKRTLGVSSANGKFFITTKEYFRSNASYFSEVDIVIVDEAHYFSGISSKMSKSLQNFVKNYSIERILLLTATPYMSTPWNIYTLGSLLGWRWSYQKFRDEFFEQRIIGYRMMGSNKVPKKVYVPRSGIEPEMARLVSKIGHVVHMSEAADIPEQVFEVAPIKINGKQRKAMLSLEEDNPVVRFTKFHQIENGTLKGNAYEEDRLIENDKLDIIKTYAEGTQKIAVICRYNLQVEQIRKALSKIKEDVYVINGATKNKDEIVQAVESNNNCAVIINASCSEGYELPSISTIIFASLSYSYKDYKQMLGRFLRINRLSKNFFLHLITQYEENSIRKQSVDEAVYQSVKNKQDFDIAIYSSSMTTNAGSPD